MGIHRGTFIGPFAEWRGPDDLPEPDYTTVISFVHEAGPRVLSRPGQAEFRSDDGGRAVRRYLYFPYPAYGVPEAEAPFPRAMNFDGNQLAGDEAVIEAAGPRVPLGPRFGSAAAALDLPGVDPAAEMGWFRAAYREHLARLARHYGGPPRVAWGLISYWG